MVRYRAMLANWVKNGPPLYMAYAIIQGIVKPKPADTITDFQDVANAIAALPGGMSEPSPFPDLEASPHHV